MGGPETVKCLAKLLFLDLYINVSLARLPLQFRKLGAEVYGLGMPGGLILQPECLQKRYHFPGNSVANIRFQPLARRFTAVINDCRPDFLMTNDEKLIKALLYLRGYLRNLDRPLSDPEVAVLALLDKSLVADGALYQRQNSLKLAADAGFPIPRFIEAKSIKEIQAHLNSAHKPGFIKLSFAAGSSGVIEVTEKTNIEIVQQKLSRVGYNLSDTQVAILQDRAAGEELTVSFAAWEGKLLGYTVVRPLQKMFHNGPSAVIENLYRPTWQAPLEKLVASLGLNGFGGLDVFESDHKALPEVIEVNMRSTHTVPSSKLLGNDLVSLFYQALHTPDELPRSIAHMDTGKTIAMFPEAIIADPDSDFLKTLPLDINWEEEALNTYLMKQVYKLRKHRR